MIPRANHSYLVALHSTSDIEDFLRGVDEADDRELVEACRAEIKRRELEDSGHNWRHRMDEELKLLRDLAKEALHFYKYNPDWETIEGLDCGLAGDFTGALYEYFCWLQENNPDLVKTLDDPEGTGLHC